ncbi:hypothetical protein JNUCC1_00978 [Lentibacillus sp. JNUCC-1]|uniref:EpsG family protein n=1 Tax=Lentibacillus sp. JNUCC-1 TaxID=2654513 RepID=UPI0012E7A0E4|nr:EpsG family protein [Lentibacillus sp. JNUCC-1]MUV37172.1 hypothetical protein [Lentibacillus sp. JNUCC-1]
MEFIDSTIDKKDFNLSYKNSNFKKETDVFVVYLYIITAVILCVALPDEYLNTMLYYIAVVLSAVMFAGLAQSSKTSLFFNVYAFLSFAVLFFTYGFRRFSAIDDSSYIKIFNYVSQDGWFDYFLNSTMEPGYLILNNIVALFTEDYLYMQLVTSFIPLFLFYYGFKKYRYMISLPTAVFLLSTMLYFQMLSVALVRMFIAISIVFIAFDYIPKRKPIKYFLLIFLASLFHYSAFFMIILVYFAINKSNLSKKASRSYNILFITAPILFIFVSEFIVPLLGSRYTKYGSIDGVSISISSFSTVPLLILLLFYYKKFYGKQQLYFKLFLTVYALSIIISLFGSMVNLGRLIFYSYTAFILGAAMVSKLLSRDSKKLLYSSIIIVYGFLYVYTTQFTLEHHVSYLFPYRNIFFSL